MARPTPPANPGPPDFGPNVLIFDSDTPQGQITSALAAAYTAADQSTSEMSSTRCALFFKPGRNGIPYNVTVDVGYYMTIHGLGATPDEVTINGHIESLATRTRGMALDSFWRGVENVSVKSPNNIWAVSQATYLRRVRFQGDLTLGDTRFAFTESAFTSGGFAADCVIEGPKGVDQFTQQQFLTRNCSFNSWIGGVWNAVFVGDSIAKTLAGTWPTSPYTVINQTPFIREKPFLSFDNSKQEYRVMVPDWATGTSGTSWLNKDAPRTSYSIDDFYIAKPARDNADTINAALIRGNHLIFTPGIYHLYKSVNVTLPKTVVMGLGMATLIPVKGTPAMVISDVDGVSVSGLIIDAGPQKSPQLLLVGQATSNRPSHSMDPTVLYDICCRVGGPSPATAVNCVTINSHNVVIDNMWLWRADHPLGSGAGWTINPCENGITVNGDEVIAYGLFVEHFQEYQTIWNGNSGKVYFYQSEIPYDVPDPAEQPAAWQIPGSTKKGYASYKVNQNVTSHTAQGLGVYCNFTEGPVLLDSAIEAPTNNPDVKLSHMTTIWLNGVAGSGINGILNGQGGAVTSRANMKQQL